MGNNPVNYFTYVINNFFRFIFLNYLNNFFCLKLSYFILLLHLHYNCVVNFLCSTIFFYFFFYILLLRLVGNHSVLYAFPRKLILLSSYSFIFITLVLFLRGYFHQSTSCYMASFGETRYFYPFFLLYYTSLLLLSGL